MLHDLLEATDVRNSVIIHAQLRRPGRNPSPRMQPGNQGNNLPNEVYWRSDVVGSGVSATATATSTLAHELAHAWSYQEVPGDDGAMGERFPNQNDTIPGNVREAEVHAVRIENQIGREIDPNWQDRLAYPQRGSGQLIPLPRPTLQYFRYNNCDDFADWFQRLHHNHWGHHYPFG